MSVSSAKASIFLPILNVPMYSDEPILPILVLNSKMVLIDFVASTQLPSPFGQHQIK